MELPTQDNFNREVYATLCVIAGVLISKGLITEKEFESTKARCMAQTDQDLAQRREDFVKTPEGKLLAAIGAI